MKLGRDGVTQLEDDEEDTTVAPVKSEEELAEEQRLAEEKRVGDENEAKGFNRDGTPKDAPADEPADETVVTIGDEASPADEVDDKAAPQWVKDLRVSHRELQREKRELEAKLAAVSGATIKQPDELGEKPKLEDFDYDQTKFEQELTAWHDRKRQADEAARKKQEDQANEQKAWKAKLDAYGEAKAKLKVKDADDAEAMAQSTLSQTQQGVILQGADNPALLIYALGKNPKRAKALATITDPVKFAFAVAKLETQLKVTTRKAPAPESTPTGSAPKSGAVDSNLARLRAEAERTGDYSKVTEYKREQRQKAKAA